ncbi:hypothetical protein ABEB36_007347 [Hypothenemus hampei]|uniref:RNase NYN domain-containing protein n=1 Tax=Hypothenemus hampei TaxID=57062 RepID=A0ABD1EXM4_HYPHA
MDSLSKNDKSNEAPIQLKSVQDRPQMVNNHGGCLSLISGKNKRSNPLETDKNTKKRRHSNDESDFETTSKHLKLNPKIFNKQRFHNFPNRKYQKNGKNRRNRRNRRNRKEICLTEKTIPQSTNDYAHHVAYLSKYGKNFYCPINQKPKSGLKPIYIDGSNVAFLHGQNERFSVAGLKICIDFFIKRGHEVKAFVPHYRLRKGQTTDQELLHELYRKKLIITTPTLYIHNERRSPYDDWYIVQSAAANGGIIVSADNFQDILTSNPNLRGVVEEQRKNT